MSDQNLTDARRSTRMKLRLLGGFGITVGQRQVVLPPSSQRVLVALALRPKIRDRMRVGALLYPESRRSQISASLRTALWRAKSQAGEALVESRGQLLHLVDDVEVDLNCWTERARLLTSPNPLDGAASDVEAFSQELLPSWDDDWLQLDQQRWDQLRLHALERLADGLASAGCYMEALEAGLAAVSIEPYRESAHRAVIRTFIAEGNSASAVAQYHRYRRLVTHELGLRPTSQLQALVHDLTRE
jgi:DNA-binding SARP family transcriptional activator